MLASSDVTRAAAKPVKVAAAEEARVAKILSSTRYSTPIVTSFPLKGVVKVSQVSFIGNA